MEPYYYTPGISMAYSSFWNVHPDLEEKLLALPDDAQQEVLRDVHSAEELRDRMEHYQLLQ